MVRRSGWVRGLGLGFRGIAVVGGTLAFVFPACGGKSETTEDGGGGDRSMPDDDGFIGDRGDDDVTGDSSDDDSGGPIGGRGGSTPTPPQGGIGATGGAVITGGAFPAGGTVPTGGTIAVGGTVGQGGTPATGGTIPTGGTGVGGSVTAGVGGTGGVNTNPECKGISNNQPCVTEGLQCANLICGLADSGRRTCNCATNWSCTACDYTSSPFRDRPAIIPACPAGIGDEVTCTQENSVCGPVGSEYCACYQNPADGLIWDCDNPPSTW